MAHADGRRDKVMRGDKVSEDHLDHRDWELLMRGFAEIVISFEKTRVCVHMHCEETCFFSHKREA